MAAQIQEFRVLAAHKIVGFPDGNIISWCPQMDLLAVSMNLTSIWVFRLDGERVYSINNRAKILHLQWSASGKFFAVSGSDNAIKVYDSNNGKLINLLATRAGLPITLVSWASIDIPLSISPDGTAAPFRDLAKVEILDKMPKLANETDPSVSVDISGTLGATGTPATSAAHQSSPHTSSLVTNTTQKDSQMDYLLVINGDKHVSVTFNNLFSVVDIELPPTEPLKFLKHAMAADFFEQSLLARDSSLRLWLQHLSIDVKGPRERGYFFDSIKWASQTISIMNHVNDQFCSMQREAREFLALYDRYMSNYKDCLYADRQVDANTARAEDMEDNEEDEEIEEMLVVDLGNMLLTGLIPVSTKDYWLNQFGERGLNRLSTLGNNVYDNIRKIIFTQVILGLEKLIILLSYLRGLSKATNIMQEENYGITLDLVQNAISIAKNLVKKSYSFIWELNNEHEYFNQFLNWVQIEVIEKLSKEDNDPESFFAEHPTLDFKASLIMEYFTDYMFDSVLMREFELDCASHDTLKHKEHLNLSFKAHISDLETQLQASLKDMQSYFALKVKFHLAAGLDTICHGTHSNMAILDGRKIVTSINETVLSVTSIKDDVTKMDIRFPGQIISLELLDQSTILVLYEGDETTRHVDLIAFSIEATSVNASELKVLKTFAFNQKTPVKRPAYMTINSKEKKTGTIALVLDESKKDYMLLAV